MKELRPRFGGVGVAGAFAEFRKRAYKRHEPSEQFRIAPLGIAAWQVLPVDQLVLRGGHRKTEQQPVEAAAPAEFPEFKVAETPPRRRALPDQFAQGFHLRIGDAELLPQGGRVEQ